MELALDYQKGIEREHLKQHSVLGIGGTCSPLIHKGHMRLRIVLNSLYTMFFQADNADAF